METLYKEMLERLAYIKALPDTEENHGRYKELQLAIVRIQQLLLIEIKP